MSVGVGERCNFDFNLCNYTQDTTDQLDWVRINGASSMDDTGPSADHTHGTSQGELVKERIGHGGTEGDQKIGEFLPKATQGCLRVTRFVV